MNSIIAWFSNLWYSWFPASLPSLKKMERKVDNASARDWKTSGVAVAKCGLLVCTYHNITRTDAAIDLIDLNTGKSRNLIRTNYETFGRPVLNGGWWYFPAENRVGKIVRVRDSDGRVETGRTQPEDYSACGIDEWFPISKSQRSGGSKPRLWSFLTGKSGYQYKKLHGIASSIVKWGGQTVISVSDGAESGIESDSGAAISDDLAPVRENWAVPTVNVVSGKLIAFRKNGSVMHIESMKPIKAKQIGSVGMKPCRSVSSGGVIYWTTSNPDALCATNGSKVSVLWKAPGSDLSDGTSSGSLFDTDVAVYGKRVIVVRSQQNGGYEVWMGELG